MKIDAKSSVYHEDPRAHREFTADEIDKMRFLLRRLRFLETQERKYGNDITSGGNVFVRLEIEALEFVLDEMGFLDTARMKALKNGRRRSTRA